MPSPFPGMDPYLEAVWPDVHVRLLVEFGNALNGSLPPRYATQIDQHVWLVEPAASERGLLGRPDVAVIDRSPAPPSAAAAVLDAPVVTLLPVVPRLGERFLRVVERASRRVVTVIELLSPSNKGSDRANTLTERQDYLAGGVNVVEIDLLRGGEPLPSGSPPAGPYSVLVARHALVPWAGLWPVGLRDPLPTIRIPLADGDADATLALQPALDRVYDAGRFDRVIDYTAPVAPPLPDPDAAWARDLFAARSPEGR